MDELTDGEGNERTDRGGMDRRTMLKATGLAGLAGAGMAGLGFAQEEGERLSWHAGGTGGTYFPLSNEFKTIVEEATDFTLQVQSTGASVENVGSLARGDADFALIQNDIASFAFNGTGIEEFEGEPIANLRGVATLYPETIHVVTLAESEIESAADLEGAIVNTGDLGSGTQVNALGILDAAGVEEFTEQNAGFAQAADQLRNGDIDAAILVGGWPVGSVAELATTNDISIVPIDGELREELKERNAFYADDEIPGGTYSGVDEAVPTIAVQAMIATQAEQSDAVVEAVSAAIFDNADQLTIKSDFISTETAMDGMSISVHPGARTYFEGQGVMVPTNVTAAGANETAPPENATVEGNETAAGNETVGNESA